LIRDGWLDPGTCAVRLAPFEELTRLLTSAGPSLDSLAAQLSQALGAAGVPTGPANEIRRLATWAREAGADLRRRNQLVHDLDRQRLAFEVCRPDGIFVRLPDRYSDQLAESQGREAARLLRESASGDPQALRALCTMSREAASPYFAHGLLTTLGPSNVVGLPLLLAESLKAAQNRFSSDAGELADLTRSALSILGTALAVGTQPQSPLAGPLIPVPAYAGDDFVSGLRDACHDRFAVALVGYQGLSALLATSAQPFSAHFMSVVGRDMISYDRAIAPSLPGTPLPSLASVYDLGSALGPSAARTDFLVPLLSAAARSTQASQALLDPPSLAYLLHTRRSIWSLSDQGAALGRALKAAAAGPDPASRDVFDQALAVLGPDVLTYAKWAEDDKLALSEDDKDALDQFRAMRGPLGDLLISRLGLIGKRLHSLDSNPDQLDWQRNLQAVLADVLQDDGACQALMRAQIAHTKLWLDEQYTKDNGQHLDPADLQREIGLLGRMIALRQEIMRGREDGTKDYNEGLKRDIAGLIGDIPIPGAKSLGGLGGELLKQGKAYSLDQAGTWLAHQFGDDTEQRNTAPIRAGDAEAVRILLEQMLISSAVAHAHFPAADLQDKSFAENGKILPPNTWTWEQNDSFSNWCKEHNIPVWRVSRETQEFIESTRSDAIKSFLPPTKKLRT
jgi:hypothetical protein